MPQSRTLFYPLPEGNSDNSLTTTIALIPALVALVLFAIFAPVMLIVIPMAWLSCKLEGLPFTPLSDPYAMLTESEQRRFLGKNNC